jgi:hypothetical protein
MPCYRRIKSFTALPFGVERQCFLYLMTLLDLDSRLVLAWEEALQYGHPEIFNTVQGAQFGHRIIRTPVAAPFSASD